jgi:hypothetical protein
MLFPTGRLRSRRWLPAAWFVGAVYVFTGVVLLVRATRIWEHPFAAFPGGLNHAVLRALLTLVPATLVVSVAAVVARYALSRGEERLQLKWFAAAALVVVAAMIPVIVTNSVAASVVENLAFLCLYTAIAIAVLKYRLYEIDIVISKAART